MKSAMDVIKQASCLEEAKDTILLDIINYNISELICPKGGKSYYGECAYILSQMPCSIISQYAVELMQWFQDLNWPGVRQIHNALRRLPRDELRSALKQALQEARMSLDEEWSYNLQQSFGDMLNECDQGDGSAD